MVDNLNTDDSGAVVEAAPSAGGIRGFLATTTGKLIVGGALILLLLVAVGFVVFPMLFGGGDAPTDQVTVPPAGSVPSTGTASQSEEATPTYRKPKPLSTVFVFRDIFEPTINPVLATSPDTTGTASGDTSGTADGDIPDLPPDTLFLMSVDTVDGEPVATFVWNGQTYTAGEGDSLEGTPWQVLSIEGDTVVMMYGDSRVTLTVGQGLTK